MVDSDKKEYERMKVELHDRLKERDVRIEHLQERIKDSADMTDN
jgi:PHD/YefM family antitoxin component YafN of YafNO toxin-antitoxin module